MPTDGRGRPRPERSRRPGNTARDEILDAAAELFTALGTPARRRGGSPTRWACAIRRCITTSPPRTTSSTRCWRARWTTRCGGPPEADDLPFRLVESVINWRSDDAGCAPDQPWLIADGALRVLGWDGDFARVRTAPAQRLGLAPVSPVPG